MKRIPARVYVPVLAALVCAGALIGVTEARDDPHGTPGRSYDADGTLKIDAARRSVAPDIAGTGTDGRTVRLSAYRGKTVVVNVWASWCGPCRQETPMLVRYQEETKGQGVVVLGLNEDDSAGDARAFARTYHMSYASLLDPDGKQFRKLAKGLVSTQGLPVTLVIDPRGRVAAATAGALSEARLTSAVTAARTGS
ncbi:TlpA family protein disulfide reductase [Streptomyces sp. cg40]|uniref:TlpA family protein disulfide reductase n=1 Tax=Streptomyces sp. cg40 TaxID=3419764 RepID=UPI003D00111A